MALVVLAISRLLDAVKLLLLIRCIISWIPNFRNSFTDLLYKITDPILLPAQKMLYSLMKGSYMMVDFSPIVVYFLIGLVQRLLFAIL